MRKATGSEQQVYVVSNFTPVPREQFRLGVQRPGKYKLVLNTDDRVYWGSGYQCEKQFNATPVSWNNQPHSIEITLPPLATVFIVIE